MSPLELYFAGVVSKSRCASPHPPMPAMSGTTLIDPPDRVIGAGAATKDRFTWLSMREPPCPFYIGGKYSPPPHGHHCIRPGQTRETGSLQTVRTTTQSRVFAPPNHGPLEVPGFCGFWAIDDRVETELRRRRVRFRAEVSAGLFWRPNHGDTLAPRVTKVQPEKQSKRR